MNSMLARESARRGAAAAAILLLSLAACSGSADPEPETPVSTTPSATATADPVATDEAEVADLVDGYWVAILDAENNATTRRSQFDGLAQGEFLEAVFRKLDRYESKNIRRVGAPTISEVEIGVTGDTATIVHCLDEDQWTATQDGKPLDPILDGNRPFGLTATRVDGAWLVTGTGLSESQKKEKSCA